MTSKSMKGTHKPAPKRIAADPQELEKALIQRREHFAAQAMHGLLQQPGILKDLDPEGVARAAVKAADALIKELYDIDLSDKPEPLD